MEMWKRFSLKTVAGISMQEFVAGELEKKKRLCMLRKLGKWPPLWWNVEQLSFNFVSELFSV